MVKWLRKNSVAERRDCEPRSVDRDVADGRLPPPEYPFGNLIPAWREDVLDAHERATAHAVAAAGGKAKTAPSDEVRAKARLARKMKAGLARASPEAA